MASCDSRVLAGLCGGAPNRRVLLGRCGSQAWFEDAYVTGTIKKKGKGKDKYVVAWEQEGWKDEEVELAPRGRRGVQGMPEDADFLFGSPPMSLPPLRAVGASRGRWPPLVCQNLAPLFDAKYTREVVCPP